MQSFGATTKETSDYSDYKLNLIQFA